jgi:Mn2+/Fe2+ NRAMP family transporter
VGILGATIMSHNLYLHAQLAKARLKEKLAAARTVPLFDGR